MAFLLQLSEPGFMGLKDKQDHLLWFQSINEH
jgi:hypothetical protein